MRNELIRLVLLEGLNMKHTLDSRFYRIMTAKIVELFPGEKPVRKLFFIIVLHVHLLYCVLGNVLSSRVYCR